MPFHVYWFHAEQGIGLQYLLLKQLYEIRRTMGTISVKRWLLLVKRFVQGGFKKSVIIES